MPSTADLLAEAKAYQGVGDHRRAIDCLRQAVRAEPDCAEAHHQLGLLLFEQGMLEEAAGCWRRVLELMPRSTVALGNLGNVLKRQGRLDEAVDYYRRILNLDPDCAEAYHDLGLIAQRQGNVDAALEHFRRALELRPNFAAAHANLGSALAAAGRFEEAADCYRKAIGLNPSFAEALGSLTAVLANLAQFDEAIVCGRRAVELMPNRSEAHYNLALAVGGQGKLEEAVAGFQRAVQLAPHFSEAHANLGAALGDLGRAAEAINSCRRALELRGDDADCLANLASLFNMQGRVAEARECYDHALRLRPEMDIWRLRAATLCPAVFHDVREIESYRHTVHDELQRFSERPFRCDVATLHGSSCTPPFNLQFHGLDDRPIRGAYARIFRDCFPAREAPGSGGRRRIGFVVTARHEKLFLRSMGGVLEHIPKGRFELVVVCSRRGVAGLRHALGSSEISFLALPTRFDQMLTAVRDARFDVLYFWEIGTDCINYFLPHARLAPVQCTGWGMQVTSGIEQVNHYLSSRLVEPEGAQQHYTEQLILADTLLTYQRRVLPPSQPKAREDFEISGDAHLYLCAQQLGKFHPDFDLVLADILRRDPRGTIVTVEDQHGGFVAGELRRRFASTMPDVAGRIRFLPFQSGPDYLSLVAAADVLLDPLHFSGANSTYDGFSLDKPVVTLPSQFARGRYTLACYRKMGLDDCIAADARHYVDIAVSLGTDPGFRSAIANRIRDASPALFEDSQAVLEHERIFEALLETHRPAQ